MSTNYRPAHGSGAQVVEFTATLAAHGLDRPDAPDYVKVELSTDANNTFRIAVDPRGEFPSWRMDARIVRGSIEIVQTFCDGTTIDERPHWMGTVIEEARTRLLEGSA